MSKTDPLETDSPETPTAPPTPQKKKRGRKPKPKPEKPAPENQPPPANLKKGLTYEDRVAIVRRRENRETMVAIATDYGVSRQNIAQIIDLYRKKGVEGLKSRPTGRRMMPRLTDEQIDHLREVIAQFERPSDRGVSMSRLKNVWYADSLHKLIYHEFRVKVPIIHCKELCRELRIPQSINMGLLNPVRIAEGRENHPRHSSHLAKGEGRPLSPGDDEEELCGDVEAIREKLKEHKLAEATAALEAKKKRIAAKKGFRAPAAGKGKTRHSKKKKRK